MASGFRAKREIPQLNGWLGEARDSNGDPGSVRLEEVLAGQARAITDLAMIADPAIPPEPMVNVTLTEQQIRNGDGRRGARKLRRDAARDAIRSRHGPLV